MGPLLSISHSLLQAARLSPHTHSRKFARPRVPDPLCLDCTLCSTGDRTSRIVCSSSLSSLITNSSPFPRSLSLCLCRTLLLSPLARVMLRHHLVANVCGSLGCSRLP